MSLRMLGASLMVLALAQPVMADEETELLRQQIKALEARLTELEHKQAAAAQQAQRQNPPQAPSAVQAPSLQAAAPLAARVDAIEQKESKEATVEYGNGHGLSVTSPDKQFQLRMGGYFQADNHTFIDNSNPSGNTDQSYIRSARPIFEAKLYDDFSARLMLDFGNGQTTLLDAYGDYNASDAFNLRAGKFKDPMGLERWQSEQNVLFVERGMTTNLVPYRDNGFEIYGNVIPSVLEYQLALTNGAPDLVNSTNNTDNDQTVFGRVFAHPFKETDVKVLQGVGVGVAGSYGTHGGSVTSPDLTTGYVTPAQSKFFTYLSGGTAATTAVADGEQWRFNPQATYYNGPFSLLGEYVLENQDVRVATHSKALENDAWEAIVTYVLTGEDARFDGVIPRNDFDYARNQWGAFELVGRVSELHIDDATFPTFASLATSAKAAQESTFGGTWYMNANVKLNLDFAVTQFTGGGAAGADRTTEKAILSRAQVKF